MASLEEIRQERLRKITLLKERGIDPYPNNVPRDHALAHVRKNFSALESAHETLAIAGRIMAIRGQGAILFVVLNDGTDTFQAVIKRDILGESDMQFFTEVVDIGDFISVTGTLFTTQRGEQSIQVSAWVMGAKSLLPLPEKWHGLQDQEEKFRKRYLDILFDPELKELFRKKSLFWKVTRDVLSRNGFWEVETPTLELTTGGAEARPFSTHHNDYDLDVFLRISVGELWQKRLMVAGFEKTFEIGRVYRNEGSSPNHLQEFTNLEFYWAFANYEDGMRLVQELYQTIAREVFGTMTFTSGTHTFDLSGTWPTIDYRSEVLRQTGIDITTATEADIIKTLNRLHVTYEGDNRERLTDTLWKYCRKHIAGPAFLINHPKLVSPLAKSVPGDPTKTERFQPIIAGVELGNGYSELNDQIEQRARFETQKKLLESGDGEAMMSDWEFVEALEQGMPPACGFGFGDRVFAVLANRPIREIQLFPLMRPK